MSLLATVSSKVVSVIRPGRVQSTAKATSMVLDLESSPARPTVSTQTTKRRSVFFATLSFVTQAAYFLSSIVISALHLDPYRIFYIISGILMPMTFWGLHLTGEWSARKAAGGNLPYLLWIVFAIFNFSAAIAWAALAIGPLRGEQGPFETGFMAVASAFFKITCGVYIFIIIKLCILPSVASDRDAPAQQEVHGQSGSPEKH